MRTFLLVLISAIGLSFADIAARAQALPETGSKRWKEDHARKLDDLFAALKRSNSPGEASSITSRIWSLWYESGNEDVDLLMRQARQAFPAGRAPCCDRPRRSGTAYRAALLRSLEPQGDDPFLHG